MWSCRMQPRLCSSSSSSPPLLLTLVLLFLRLTTWSTSACSETITVDWRGGGDFTTVQSAVDSVPDGNSEWVRIHVKAGCYWEKVTISSKKQYILLEGEGASATDISFDKHADDVDGIDEIMRLRRSSNKNASVVVSNGSSQTFRSATFTVLANNFVARNIAFKNAYNAVGTNRKPRPAVATLVGGDKAAFYDCAFHGFQDTLCDFQGRHYFRRCLVAGAVDFVFGFGQSVYDGCTLVSVMPPGTQPGWVTAHARDDGSAAGGLVFRGGQVTTTPGGGGTTYLGRAWNKYAVVVFYRTRMDGNVVPQGWEPWNAGADVSCVTFAEVGCVGPGSVMTGRVGWEKHLSEEEVKRFVDIKFIDDGWLSQQP